MYKAYSKDALGYVAPLTETNSQYITAVKVETWLRKGKTAKQIFLSWNAGEGAKSCSSGVNKFNVRYDSCAYVAVASSYHQ